MSSTMSANEQGGSGPTSGEFAAQTLCTTLSNLPFLSGTERALLGCIEKMITELSVIRGELDRKEKINVDLMKEYQSQQVELQWYHTELDKKDEELEGKERELKELREKLAKVQHGNDGIGNCEANILGGPARKKVKQEPLNSSHQELQENQEMPTSSNSTGTSTKERHVLPAKRKHPSHSADMADDSSSDDSKSSPNGSPPLNAAKPHKNAQKHQEVPTVPTQNVPQPQLSDYLPALLQNINVILAKHPAIVSSPSTSKQSKAKKKRANAKKGQQQQAKPKQAPTCQKEKGSPPKANPNPNDEQQNVQQQQAIAKKKKEVMVRLQSIKPRVQSAKVGALPTGLSQGQCYRMLNTHKTKNTPLYQWARETVDLELTQAGLDLNDMLVSRQTKLMLNRMMLTAMTKADPEGFMAEL